MAPPGSKSTQRCAQRALAWLSAKGAAPHTSPRHRTHLDAGDGQQAQESGQELKAAHRMGECQASMQLFKWAGGSAAWQPSGCAGWQAAGWLAAMHSTNVRTHLFWWPRWVQLNALRLASLGQLSCSGWRRHKSVGQALVNCCACLPCMCALYTRNWTLLDMGVAPTGCCVADRAHTQHGRLYLGTHLVSVQGRVLDLWGRAS